MRNNRMVVGAAAAAVDGAAAVVDGVDLAADGADLAVDGEEEDGADIAVLAAAVVVMVEGASGVAGQLKKH
ncbi:UNVERIFIED_CONTAM: hypothetical protein Slati_1299200 [Sesamum latifolium]|uniref:Uncharacterized protein n=1 Tax=Sesamum latifolium TaxID=2727402 RepID=A0AAW2XK31_9LAMI